MILYQNTGQAYMNYIKCSESPYIDICDTSIGGLGKGAGNLKLEEVVSDTKENPKESQDGPVQKRKFIGSAFAGIRRIFLTIADSWRH